MRNNNLKVLFAASECTPIAKVGGLGDVIGALPKALVRLGCDVRIVLPKYREVDLKKYNFQLVVRNQKFGGEAIDMYQGFLPESKVIVYVLANEKYFGENGVYFERTAFVGSLKEIQRFLFFSQLVLQIGSWVQWFPQIIHCNDWHTSLIPLLLKLTKRKEKTLFTIHNLANQGKWDGEEIVKFLNFPSRILNAPKEQQWNLLEQGILHADFLTTVSPTYAREIRTQEYGEGLAPLLSQRKRDFFGILNGIDEERFNPQTDPDLKTRYSCKNGERKQENKLDLQKILSLPQNGFAPLFGFIGRLTWQKGIDLILQVLPDLIRANCQLVVLGVGSEQYEKDLAAFAKTYPQHIYCRIAFDPVLAQKIYGGVDFFLMPSRFEPCGLGQMIAMRYGTIPIARKTGGLSDTIDHQKTGFLFQEYTSRAFWNAIQEALCLYKEGKEWQQLVHAAMSQDFSWQKSAQRYIELYGTLLQQYFSP